MIRYILFTSMAIGLLGCMAMANASEGWVGKTAPNFTLRTIDDKTSHSLSDFRGEVVLLDFWASWCPPCKKSLPELARLEALYDGLKVLTISIDDEQDNAQDFMKVLDLQVTTLFDSKKTVVAAYDVSGMPTALLIDKDGLVRRVFSGYTESKMEEIKSVLSALLVERIMTEK